MVRPGLTGADDIIPTNLGFSIRKENNMSNYKTSTEVISAYAHGELTLEECNRRLKELGSAPLRDPLEPKITPEMVDRKSVV